MKTTHPYSLEYCTELIIPIVRRDVTTIKSINRLGNTMNQNRHTITTTQLVIGFLLTNNTNIVDIVSNR